MKCEFPRFTESLILGRVQARCKTVQNKTQTPSDSGIKNEQFSKSLGWLNEAFVRFRGITVSPT